MHVYIPGLTLYSSVSVLLDVRAVTWRLLTVATLSASAVNSWKCVANKQNDLILVAICLEKKLGVPLLKYMYAKPNKGHKIYSQTRCRELIVQKEVSRQTSIPTRVK